MKHSFLFITLLSVGIIKPITAQRTAIHMNINATKQPIAKQISKNVGMHGDERIDNYYWISEKENPETLAYLNAENSYTKAVMKPTEKLQEKIFTEIKGRIKEDDESVPYKDGEYWYYSKFEKGGEYPLYCRRKGSLTAPEEIMLNGNEMGEGEKYFNIGGYEISDNDEIIAFGIDTISRRNYTLKFKNLKTGKVLTDEIKNTEGGSYAWAADNRTIFYMVRDQTTLLASKVYRHELGTDPTNDVLIYTETDNQFYMGLYRSKSKKYIISLSEQNGVASEYRLLDATHHAGEFKTFLPRQKGHEYSISHFATKFYVRTNKDDATNFKLMEVAEDNESDVSQWKEIVPNRNDVYLDGIEVFKNHLVIQERQNALLHIRIIDQATQKEHAIDFGEAAYDAGIANNPDFNTNILRFGYTSLTTPNSIFDYNMDTKAKTLKKEQEVPGGYDKTQYITERLWAMARDGRRIPISIVYKNGFQKNGTSNVLQYAYGSYGASTDPYFSAARLSLLDRGFAFAIAHIRGGQEMGRVWYEEGRLLQKQNTFTDFIDCSEYLIQQKWTSPSHLFANGGSAGGLLMGAIVNLRPDLYRGVVAAVPFVDVVTTMLDESIPLTTGEFEEWGNPKKKEYYNYMKSYSPYDNVSAKNYPNMLVTTGLHDSQVQYFEPAKWVAKLRAIKTDKNLLLLDCNMESGHGGASGRFKRLKEVARDYSFMLNLAGIGE